MVIMNVRPDWSFTPSLTCSLTTKLPEKRGRTTLRASNGSGGGGGSDAVLHHLERAL